MLSLYSDRVLPFDLIAAQTAGALNDRAYASGRHPGFADVAIAAIAKSRQLVILTLIHAILNGSVSPRWIRLSALMVSDTIAVRDFVQHIRRCNGSFVLTGPLQNCAGERWGEPRITELNARA